MGIGYPTLKAWKDILRSSHHDILTWAETQPWAQRMAGCQQDAAWHAEGDVWTHTKMVCHALEELEEWPNLPREEQIILLFTALFHDSGKPQTTMLDPETGHIRSPKHSIVGEELARGALRDLECDLVTREAIAALVRYHGRPAFLLDKPVPEREVIGLSWWLRNRLLHLFALADARGRKAGETARQEDLLNLWKSTAEEQGCYDRPYPFRNDQARFLFFRGKLSSLHYTPREDYRCTVTFMAGLPGAGKDTWLAQHRPDLPVVSLDEVREDLGIGPEENQGPVAQASREACRQFLRAGRDFAFNATNVTRRMRERWRFLFADYSARLEMVYLEPPMNMILERNKSRQRVVPGSVMQWLMAKTEPPTWTEAHTLRWEVGV